MKKAVEKTRLVPPIKASDQYKGYDNDEGDEAMGDTFQTTKQQPLKNDLHDKQKPICQTIKQTPQRSSRAKRTSRRVAQNAVTMRRGATNATPQKKQYDLKQRETDHNIKAE